MSVLAAKPKVPRSRKSLPPAEPPKFWLCPKCIYRIALDFPSGTREAILSHQLAHRYPMELPLSEKAKGWKRDDAILGS